MKVLRQIGSFLVKHLTFKRVIILLILFIFSLPVLKAVFWTEDELTTEAGDYEYKYLRGDEYSSNKILQISINGVIMTESVGVSGPLDFLEGGATYGYEVKETFRRAAEDPSIKGIIVTINSPGGTIPGSQAISDGIALYKKETGHPVYAHIRDMGASGAYWAAVSTDRVFVDTGSIVGSIGVLMGPFVYYDTPIQEGSILGNVTTEGGIEHTFITGGEFKDTGSPYRRMTPEERDHWQRSIDNEYTIFVNHVSKYRGIPSETIRTKIKALPYDSIEAKKLRLVDEIGNEDVAIEALVDEAGLGNDYQILYEKNKADFFEEVFSAAAKVHTPQVQSACSLCNTPLYLYDRTYSMFDSK